jgi:16S rRNA (guanine527-N7)-methyltransferase
VIVSRETDPPAAALTVFGAARLQLAAQYVELLAGPAVERGLIGPREVGRLWDRHVLNSAVLSDLVPEGASVADIGSGAGLPGLPLAIARPDCHVCLVEPMQRRVDFLREVVSALGLDFVEVVRSRAEGIHGTRSFDVVTSRAVAPLGRLASWSMPLVGTGGSMLALKGERAASEVEESRAELRSHGCGSIEVIACGAGVVDPQVTVVRVEWGGAPRVSWATRAEAGPASSGRRSSKRRRT